ncbi:PREDICTED: transcription factor IBH1-like [Camelina sativa]|uniref:Transcription factor IBH1-like n=1 Tax=Camelina sativa TaxID=90675 RepID=A0ABM0Z913_CAMSA|nr:PREDICTED: transcription factor IBH1-like [Camelina sativa]
MASSTTHSLNINTPRKNLFAVHFLRSLSKLKRQKSFIGPKKTTERVRKIKTAAYISMARAAGGTSQTWSRAILWRLHRRAQASKIGGYYTKPKKRSSGADVTRGRIWRRRSRRYETTDADRLRTVVPGGGDMETLKLMVETAHYIKCLSMQVNVMQSIVDVLSA